MRETRVEDSIVVGMNGKMMPSVVTRVNRWRKNNDGQNGTDLPVVIPITKWSYGVNAIANSRAPAQKKRAARTAREVPQLNRFQVALVTQYENLSKVKSTIR